MSIRRAVLAAAPVLALTTALTPWASAQGVPSSPGQDLTPSAAPTVVPPSASGHRAAPAYTGDIVVRFADATPSKRDAALQRVNARLSSRLAVKRAMAAGDRVVVAGAGRDRVKDIAAARARDPGVVSAEPDVLLQPSYVPNDPYYGTYQWNLQSAPAGINAPAAWDASTGSGVTVAVLDTGITSHPDLTGQTVPGYDFVSSVTAANDGTARDSDPSDPGDAVTAGECGTGAPAENSSWHGTHVAGIIGAATGNSTGIAGVARGAKVQPVRVLGKCGGSMSDIADGITWASGGTVTGVAAAAAPAKVLNLSLGGAGQCYSFLQSAIDGAVGRGSTVVVAAGNENSDATGSAPANCGNVVTVGATGNTGAKSSFSNYGAPVDLSAPGGENSSSISTFIVSSWNAGTTAPGAANYGGMIGTSQATPQVAGVAALMKSINPALTPAQIESTLKSTTHAFGAAPAVAMGTGILDAAKAVAAVTPASSPTPTSTSTTSPSPTSPTTTTSPTPTSTTAAAPAAVADSVTLSTKTTSAKVAVLANDKTTASVTTVALVNPPCTRTFCLSVNSDRTVQVKKSTTYRGSTTVTYTFTQSDGQRASSTLTVKS